LSVSTPIQPRSKSRGRGKAAKAALAALAQCARC
jgi:hypothetical protein